MTDGSSASPASAPLPGPPPRYWALYHTLVDERGRRIRRAVLTGTIAGLLAVFTLGASILPDAVTGNLVIAYLLFLVVQAIVLALALLRGSGGEYRKALIVGEFARRTSFERWRMATGEDVLPLSPQSAADWLARHPDPSELIPQRLHALINAGDRDGAHAALASYPRDSAEERYRFASDTWFLGFLDGSDAAPDQVEQLAIRIEDDEARVRAITGTATLRAYLAAAQGGDWIGPMAKPYPLVAGRITDDWRMPHLIRAWTMTMAITSAMVGGALLVARWAGVWP